MFAISFRIDSKRINCLMVLLDWLLANTDGRKSLKGNLCGFARFDGASRHPDRISPFLLVQPNVFQSDPDEGERRVNLAIGL